MSDRNNKLILDLREAAEWLREEQFECIWAASFLDANQFASELEKIAFLIEAKSWNPIVVIRCFYLWKKAKYLWFMPTFDWDDIVEGDKGVRLGHDIYCGL